MKGTTKRFDELVRLAALATLDHTRMKRYMPGGGQELSGGWSNLDDFDLATVPVCGRVRDDWLAVDIDVNCAELADREVKRVCDLIENALECPVLVFDSGSRERFGRHVWAWVGPEPASPTLIEAINSSPEPADTGVRAGGSLMRPPLGLHRLGGRSLPLNVDCEELVELLASVRTPEPASRPAPKKNEGLFERLNPNAQALLRGNVGPKHRKSDGTPDRSKVDAALATHAVNSGLSEAEFLHLRHTQYPSEKALEQRDPLGYLRAKYQDAQRLPASSDPRPAMREAVRGFVLAAEASTQIPSRRRHSALRVLTAMCDKAVTLATYRFPISLRELQRLAGVGSPETVRRALETLNSAGLVRHVESGRDELDCDRYELLVLELFASRDNPSCWGVQDECLVKRTGVLPGRNHVLFRPAVLSTASYDVLAACTEPVTRRQVVEALTGRAHRTTVYKRIKNLLQIGLLEETGKGQVVVPVGINWDETAKDLGAFEDRDLVERRIRNQQTGYLTFRVERLWARLAPGEGAVPLAVTETETRTVVVDTTTGEAVQRGDIETVLRRYAATVTRNPSASAASAGPFESEGARCRIGAVDSGSSPERLVGPG